MSTTEQQATTEASIGNVEANQSIEFSVLKQGTIDPMGPLSDEDILGMLNRSEITPHDLVFYEGLQQWQPIGEVFVIEEQLSHFVDDGQDKGRVGEIFREVSAVLGDGEEVYYIAIQEKTGLLSKAKASVVIASRHIFILREIRTGWEIEAHPWAQISNTLMRDEGKGFGTFSLLLNLGKRIDIAHFPMQQLRRLFQLSQEMREMEAQG